MSFMELLLKRKKSALLEIGDDFLGGVGVEKQKRKDGFDGFVDLWGEREGDMKVATVSSLLSQQETRHIRGRGDYMGRSRLQRFM